MEDATGREIELEKTYGYSTTSSGWAVVVIGKVRKIRPGDERQRDLVTLDVIRRQTFLYGHAAEYQKYKSKTVTISPFHLFPVTLEVDPDACCENETRDMNGGCTNCGDPCL